MKLRLIVVAVAVALGLARLAMRTNNASRSGGTSEVVNDDPVAMAKEVDQAAAEYLAQSKIDARQWLASPTHGTFQAEKKDIVKLTSDVLAAGAVGVWIGEAETVEKNEIISDLYVELPTDAAKRAKIFEVYNKDAEKFDGLEKDLGQKYLNLSWD